MVQEDAAEKEKQMQDVITQLDHENGMRQQQIETLEMYLSETKDALNKIQASSSAQLEQ
jgi:dsDNA-binding SOS-regulon protein